MARCTRLGAAWDIRRDEARLRAVGIRRGHHAEPRARTGWDSLTATQRTVASYVAQGGSPATARSISSALMSSGI
ncbi:hypothetical protein [Streptomyces sp. NPDC054765]